MQVQTLTKVSVACTQSMQMLGGLTDAVEYVMRSIAGFDMSGSAASCKHATLNDLDTVLWPAGSVHWQPLDAPNHILSLKQLAEHDMAPI